MAALQNGVDSIEHGAQPNVEMIALFKQRKAFQISTISPALPYALFDRSISHATYEQQENGKIVFDGIVALAKANLAAGVPVGLGTDVGCPYSTHYDMWRELHYFVKYCGVTPAFALYSATKLNARLAGIGDLTGSIEADKQADLIVCSGNPLQNLSALILDDHRVLIAHGHTLGVKTGLLRAQYRALEMNADILLFGHTHVPLVDAASRPMMMNPGSIGGPRRPTYGVLEFRDGQIYPSVFRLDS